MFGGQNVVNKYSIVLVLGALLLIILLHFLLLDHFKFIREYMPHEEFIYFTLGDLTTYSGDLKKLMFKYYKQNPKKLPNLIDKASELKVTWEKLKKGDLETIALAYLNLKLKEISSGKASTRFIDGKIVPAISFNNLLDAAGFQLKKAIFKDEKLKRCINCGALFEPAHASQKFCSPLPGRKRSTCENTYNQRQKRLRKKQKQ